MMVSLSSFAWFDPTLTPPGGFRDWNLIPRPRRRLDF